MMELITYTINNRNCIAYLFFIFIWSRGSGARLGEFVCVRVWNREKREIRGRRIFVSLAVKSFIPDLYQLMWLDCNFWIYLLPISSHGLWLLSTPAESFITLLIFSYGKL